MSELPPRSRPLIPGQIASWLAVLALVGAVTAASVAAFLHFRTGVSPEAARRAQQVALRAETEAKASTLLASSAKNDDGTYRIPLNDALRIAAERPEVLGKLAPAVAPAAPASSASTAFVPADEATLKRGQAVYARTCIACHQPTGMGLPPVFPPLAGSEWVAKDASIAVRNIINGMQGPITVKGMTYNSMMPPVAGLSDKDIADVVNYVNNSWGNAGPNVTEAEVAAIKKKYADRKTPWTAAEYEKEAKEAPAKK